MMKQILKQLLQVNKENIKERNNTKNSLIPLVKQYCSSPLRKKYKLLKNKNTSNKLMYLARLIIDKQIKINVSEEGAEMLHLLTSNDLDKSDKAIILAEDLRTINYFKRSINVLESSLKQVKNVKLNKYFLNMVYVYFLILFVSTFHEINMGQSVKKLGLINVVGVVEEPRRGTNAFAIYAIETFLNKTVLKRHQAI